LPVATVALAGYPTHVITVNDYLAKRDAEEMEPLYQFLGLSVGSVIQGMKKPDRREAYSRSITYCSNKELAFDYLRDRVAMTNRGSKLHLLLKNLHGSAKKNDDLVLRGLFYGIVDEADSVFIDEARTPLILSSSVEEADEKQQCERALQIARDLDPARDYTVNRADRNVTLTENGRDALAAASRDLDGIWSSIRTREELLAQALTALHLYHRDQHYVVAEGKVQIVDESTGRVMPDRSWERGLHQLIEVKEGCEPTQRRETLARITYQRLFRRYIRLAGMTGTAREVESEIRSIYGLDVVRIPLHRPLQRRNRGQRVFLTGPEKWRHIADVVERLAMAEKRPVLIGTRSVRASEELSEMLRERRIEHALLNAKQDLAEADIVRLAGLPSRVTVATNMAGRGTDIRLGEGVGQDGGLHVILTEFHESARTDRQLFGRSGRQGDPGSYEAIVSLEDELYAVYAPTALRWVSAVARRTGTLPVIMYEVLRIVAQSRAGRRSAQVRMQNLALDRKLDSLMAFAGSSE
jgi:preprotein translocase subunit SecA